MVFLAEDQSDVTAGRAASSNNRLEAPARTRRRRGARRKPLPSTAWSAAPGMTPRSSILSTSSTQLWNLVGSAPVTPPPAGNRAPRGMRARPRAWPRTSRSAPRSALFPRGTPTRRYPRLRACARSGLRDDGSFEFVGNAPDECRLQLRGQELIHGPHPRHRFGRRGPDRGRIHDHGDRRRRPADGGRRQRDRRSRTRPRPRSSAGQRHPTPTADPWRSLGHAAGERHGGGRRGRHRLTYSPNPGYCSPRRHVHLHAQRRLDGDRLGHGQRASTTAGGGRRRRQVPEDSAATPLAVLANDAEATAIR